MQLGSLLLNVKFVVLIKFKPMDKNTYYFSHDFNASDDVKVLFLRQELGMEGVGIYWYIVEKLAQAGGRLPLKVIPVLAMQMQTTDTKVGAVIKSFDLFEVSEYEFFSNRLLKTIQLFDSVKKRLSAGGKKGMEARWGNKKDKPETKRHKPTDW